MINVKPISVNSCWQGRRFATKEFKAWQAEVIRQMYELAISSKNKNLPVKWGKIHLHLDILLKHPLQSDVDNYEKPIIDCLVKSGWIEDDRYIFKITVEKIKWATEGFNFSLAEFI